MRPAPVRGTLVMEPPRGGGVLWEVGKMADKSERGFASMDDKQQRKIASEGGKAAHEGGNAHEFDSREAREAGRKGGEAVSKDREHMAEIGRKGGEEVSRDREHMAEIGEKGGEARRDGDRGRGGSR